MTDLNLVVRRMERIREELSEDQSLSRKLVKELRREYDALLTELLERTNQQHLAKP